MKRFNKKLPVLTALALAMQAAFANGDIVVAPVSGVGYTVQSDYLYITLNNNGYIGNGNAAPGIEHDPNGTRAFSSSADYLTPGAAFEGFYVSGNTLSGSFSVGNNNLGVRAIAPIGLVNTSTPSQSIFTWYGTYAGVFNIANVYSFTNAGQNINISTSITALTDLANLKFLRTTDPDQDAVAGMVGATPSTNNQLGLSLITASGAPVVISGTDIVCGAGPVRTNLRECIYSSSSTTHQAGISSAWTTNPANYLAASPLNDGNGDYAIGMGFDIGSLANGASSTFSYSYFFADSADVIDTILADSVSPSGNIPDIVSANNRNSGNPSGFNVVSNIGAGVYNNRFDGGTLLVDSSGGTAASFTITSNNAYIDHSDNTGTFSGVFSDDGSSHGRLIITNTGNLGQGYVELTGVNTHSGGTEVEAGANLKVSAASALGIGTLDLVGSMSRPAKLTTTQDMAINNQITVSGAAVFSVDPGTTTTVSAGITDGLASGDVVVNGGGTLRLTAVNAYTGKTTISNASTLELSGGLASISTTAGVVNKGAMDIAAASSSVAFSGTASTPTSSYTQTDSGRLIMSAAPNGFQKLVVAGSASLAGTLNLHAAAGNYRIGRYVLLDANGGVSGAFSTFSNNLANVTRLGYQLGYSANQVYLYLAPNASDTLQSVQQNAYGLQATYNQQLAAYQAALTYDCEVYDQNNLCVSVGGRYAYAGASPSENAQSGLVVLGYRPIERFRMGVFADQSVNLNAPGGIKQTKNAPTWGLFANWNMNRDSTGLGIQAAAATSSSSIQMTRTASATTEGGQGTAQFTGAAYQLTANYHQRVTDATKIVPYLGLRYTQLSMGAYNEDVNGGQITAPLSYNAMSQNAFSAIGGVGVRSLLAEKITGTASVGLQQNLSYKMDSYQGTSIIPGLATFSTQVAGNTNTMATAAAGIYYDVNKRERLGFTVLWQQQPFIATSTASATATYTIGF